MLQLVNLSNYKSDMDLIHNRAECLQVFLQCRRLDGIEMMFCQPWDPLIHRQEWIHGVHLKFWPCWLDFWRGNQAELLSQMGSRENIAACYGGLDREAWLEIYRENIRMANRAGAEYLVFHVSHVRSLETFTGHFSAADREVIEGTIEVVNELAGEIPDETALLFENLWWPGLTLQDKKLTALLLESIKHPNVGIMLDTGHLMNTNPDLRTEEEGVDYILHTLERLGEYSRYIRGIHLHQSLSGQYVVSSKKQREHDATMTGVMQHVLKIDEHLPFTTPSVWRILEYVQPDYLVHEFLQLSMDAWTEKVSRQQRALGLGRTFE
ncbi:MAG: TIM barrel protein [Veillonellales bacterium]